MLLSLSSGLENVVQFLTMLLIFVFVLGVTYFTTRYIAAIQKDRYKTGNMELVESLRISGNKYLQLVKAGNKYYCIAVCKDTVTLLGEIQKEEIVFYENSVDVNLKFQDILDKMKHKQLDSRKKDTNEGNRR